jgi:hypothetical protein
MNSADIGFLLVSLSVVFITGKQCIDLRREPKPGSSLRASPKASQVEGLDEKIGFYSENEFDAGRLKRTAGGCGNGLLELGRSCIAESHRSFATINLLRTAIANYAVEHGSGCDFG